MQKAIEKLNDVEAELEGAACRMPQDLPWQHVQNALVALRSVRADLVAMPALPLASELGGNAPTVGDLEAAQMSEGGGNG